MTPVAQSGDSPGDEVKSATFTGPVLNLEVGSIAYGGYIFYLGEDGHGLVCTMNDYGWTGWSSDFGLTGATATALFTGQSNTTIIINAGLGNTAAGIYNGLVQNGYDDWFMPSRDELSLMCTNLKQNDIGGFISDSYMSSSDYDYFFVISVYFGDCGTGLVDKPNGAILRCVRQF